MRNFNTDHLSKTLNMSSYDVTGRHSIAGLFPSREQAIKAVNELKSFGFKDEQIGLITRDRNANNELIEHHDDTASGAASGAVGGTLLGGLVGLLLGTGALLIPGIGPVVAGGLFASSAVGMTALGAGAGAAGGALLGALTDIGIADDEAKYFESGFRNGSTLVTIKSDDRLNEALEIIVRNGGDVGNYYRSTSYNAPVDSTLDYKTDSTLNRDFDYVQKDMINDVNYDKDRFNTDQTIQLKEEELKINKERQQAGEVIVNKEVIEEQKRVEVPVMREEVIIERHKVNRPVEDGFISSTDSQEIRVPLMEERVNVDKQAFVTEEINVGKKQVQDTKVVDETLRKEKAHFETTGNTTMRQSDLNSDIDMDQRRD